MEGGRRLMKRDRKSGGGEGVASIKQAKEERKMEMDNGRQRHYANLTN